MTPSLLYRESDGIIWRAVEGELQRSEMDAETWCSLYSTLIGYSRSCQRIFWGVGIESLGFTLQGCAFHVN